MDYIEFLKLFHPAGPWVLTAITRDNKGIETQTFGPRTEADARAWIDARNGKLNLYFSVNRPIRALDKKAERKDIHEIAALHVDVDARAGEDLGEELKRIRLLLTERLPSGVLSPTFVVFSGGGYQAFWMLREPVVIEGDLAKAEELASYNRALELALGGDNCSNVDRVMRLPGTTNIPTSDQEARQDRQDRGRSELLRHDAFRVTAWRLLRQDLRACNPEHRAYARPCRR